MSSVSHENLTSILAHWFAPGELAGVEVEAIAGGLSEAKLWKVRKTQEAFCLRCWPSNFWPNVERLRAVHGLIEHVWIAGFQLVPLLRNTSSHTTFIEERGHLWELTTWLSGAVVESPTEEQSTATIDALAKFHAAALSYGNQRVAVAPGLQKRVAVLEDLQRGQLADLLNSVHCAAPSTEREVALAILDDLAFVLPQAATHVYVRSTVPLPLQWCLRDVHIGNFLFSGDAVTGLVDYGAASIDSVVGDLARLVASFAGQDRSTWRSAVERYEQRRPLNIDERQAMGAYAIGGWIGAAVNWLRWRFVEERAFANAAITQTRLSDLAARIKSLRVGDGIFSEQFLGA